jgi:DNA modification methylase
MTRPAVTLQLGDCLDVLRGLPNASVDSVVTDPPYGLAFMGQRWDYDVPSEADYLTIAQAERPQPSLFDQVAD